MPRIISRVVLIGSLLVMASGATALARDSEESGRNAINVVQIAPGVSRVVDHGTGLELDRVRQIAAGADGTIWIAGSRKLSRLGDIGLIRKPERIHRVSDLDVAPDGELLVTGGSVAGYSGGTWTKYWVGPRQAHVSQSVGVMTTTGTLWAKSSDIRGLGIARWTGDAWAHRGHPCYCTTSAIVETADGRVWMGVAGIGGLQGFSGTGLYRLDGQGWEEVRPFANRRHEVGDMSAGGGNLWVTILPESADVPNTADYSEASLARWDGAEWTAFRWPTWLQPKLEQLHPNSGTDGFHPTLSRGMAVAPDGTLWFKRPLMSFDGNTWTRYPIPHGPGVVRPRIDDFSMAPDGTIWLVVRDYTRWHPGQPDGIYVVDPEAAIATRSEEGQPAGVAAAAALPGDGAS